MEKVCFKCQILKPLSDFYKHKQMGDGHLNKCKDCTKKDVGKHREENLEKIREYDRNRPNKEKRIETMVEYTREYRARFPNKYKAHLLVNSSLKSGKLLKEPCKICGVSERVIAHHNDYIKPLDVTWLCEIHHKQWHLENGEGLNGKDEVVDEAA